MGYYNMMQKEVDTNQSLNSESTISQHLKIYGEEMSEYDLLRVSLEGFKIEEEGSTVDIMSYREELQQTLDKIGKKKHQAYESHNAIEKFRACLSFFRFSPLQQNDSFLQNSIQLHLNFIHNFQSKIDEILQKINSYRILRARMNRIREQSIRINGLIHKKYNLTNYIEQMQLIKDLLNRVTDKLTSGNFDYRFLEELMSKELIPYHFYHNYCYNIVCNIISSRLQEGTLIIIKQNAHLVELFSHMKIFFFYEQDVYKNCSQFLRLFKYIRIINQQNLSIEDGFIFLFKPFFLDVLQEVQEVEGTTFLKARSLMQSNDHTIEIWKEYEDLQIERYILWNYEEHNQLKKSELLHLARVKESISFFKRNYEWMATIGLKNSKIQGGHDFVSEYLKAYLLKIFGPVLKQLYRAALPKEKKTYEKYKKQFESYWFCCIFGRYNNLYRFFGKDLRQTMGGNQVDLRDSLEDGELNHDQYYKYFQQMEEVLTEHISNTNVGKEFRELWLESWIRFCSSSQTVEKLKVEMPLFHEEIDHFYRIKEMEDNLEKALSSKQPMKKDQRADCLYGIVMNLNLNSCRFFLLRQGIKCLEKSAEKQIKMIREVAYQQLMS